jgi:taurine---2-oxoglutarate transaminase
MVARQRPGFNPGYDRRKRAKERQVAIVESNTELGRRVSELDKQYVLHSWSVQNQISPLPVAGGEGSYFWDYDGNRYLDFASQLVNVSIGHQHPKVVAAIKEQADKLCTIGPPMAHEKRSELARLIAEVTPGDLTMSFFTNGGAEANENAIKLARWYTGRHKVIARYRSYHGATAGAITLTGDPRRWPAEPGIPGVVRMLDPYTYRCPAGHPDPCPVCSGGPHLEEILQYEGPNTVAAVILETIVGTNGIIVPPDGYLQSIREVCDTYGIVLICDEVMAGFGRTGKWFACEHWDVVPDILTVAKGINSGYVPLGAMIVNKRLADWVQDKFFAGGLTYSGHVLACASAVASIEAFKEEGIVENSATLGEYLAEELPRMADRHPSIGDIRGKGLFFGLELVKNRETREPLVPFNAGGEAAAPVARMAKAAMERGLYLFVHWNVVIVAPPLTITREELDEGLGVLDEVLAIADEHAA